LATSVQLSSKSDTSSSVSIAGRLIVMSVFPRILILDGAMGTMIQRHKLEEADYRGERSSRLAERPEGQQRPAGADQAGGDRAASTRSTWRPARTSSRPTPSTAPGSPRPTTACRSWPRDQPPRRAWPARSRRVHRTRSDKPRFVAGVLGPTNRTASISPDVNDPGLPQHRLRHLVEAYAASDPRAARGRRDI
jgi:5-methyltetrahydrofolate--homocysteine methyltransferase